MVPSLGHIYVITGPSGVGKGCLCQMLLEQEPNLKLSISATSRAMRPGEVDGINYHFKTRAEFETMIAHDQGHPDLEVHELLEWADYNGHYYGTPRAVVQQTLQAGHSILLEIETNGALQVKRKFPSACLIFVAPPSMEELERRLRARATESEAEIVRRLAISQHEMTLRHQFDHVLVNERLVDCLSSIRKIIAQNAQNATV